MYQGIKFIVQLGYEQIRRLKLQVLLLSLLFLSQPSLTKPQADSAVKAGRIYSIKQNEQGNPQFLEPIYAAFFYPWYKTPTVDGAWGNWEGNDHTPPINWFSNYLPLPPGAFDVASNAIHPIVGLYSSHDKDIFYWQLTQMATAKLQAGISSWWGRSASPTSMNPGANAIQGRGDFNFRQIITDWMNRPDNPYPNFRWTLYYEKESVSNPSVSEIASDLEYINTNYVNQPAFLKIDGRPVLFVYAGATDQCAMVNRWLNARAKSGVNFYLVLKLFSGYTACTAQPDSWHEYAPAVRSSDYPPYSSFISPGFWKEGDPAQLPRNLSEFESAAAAMVSAKTQWKLVETWNEWGEGTSVEPGIQVRQTTHGAAVIDPKGAPFGNRYVDILSRQFPELPAGTGVEN